MVVRSESYLFGKHNLLQGVLGTPSIILYLKIHQNTQLFKPVSMPLRKKTGTKSPNDTKTTRETLPQQTTILDKLK